MKKKNRLPIKKVSPNADLSTAKPVSEAISWEQIMDGDKITSYR